MNDLSQTVSALPQGSWIPIAALVLVGACLWVAGRRVLRTAFAGLGLVAGATTGWLIGEALPLGVPGWATAVVGGLLLAMIATMAYRAAVAVGLALVLAAGAGLAVWSAADPIGLPATTPQAEAASPDDDGSAKAALDELDAWLDRIRSGLEDDGETAAASPPTDDLPGPDAGPPLEERLEQHLAEAETLARQIVERVAAWWSTLPDGLRQRLLAATIVAAVIGFLLGTVASGFSASLVTAAGGGLALLIGLWAAACKLGGAEAAWLPSGPSSWLTAWMLLTIIGLLIQWTGRPRRADKAA